MRERKGKSEGEEGGTMREGKGNREGRGRRTEREEGGQ